MLNKLNFYQKYFWFISSFIYCTKVNEITLLCKLSLIDKFDMNVQFISRILKYLEEDLSVNPFNSNIYRLVDENRI